MAPATDTGVRDSRRACLPGPVITPAYRGIVTATSDLSGTGELSAESPLVTAPTPPEGWFVSLVPPPDSLPLEVDLRGPSELPLPVPPARVAEAVSAAADVVDLTPPAAAAARPATQADAADPAVRPCAPLPPELSPRPGGVVAAARPRPEAAAQQPTASSGRPSLRSLWRGGLPTPAVLAAAALVLLPGVVLDLARDGTFGLPSAVLFVLAAAGVPLLLRARSLAVGAVLPPLLFAGAATTIAWRSGLNQGTRQIGLDVGTTMAVNAPLLFAGTAVAVAVVAGRLVVRLARR
jgi:hypothetical protein